MLSELASDELESWKLSEFVGGGADGLQDLYDYCYRPRRSIVEILYDFPRTCANIRSLDTLLDLIPAIQPRSFSIASSPRAHDTQTIQLLVAVVQYRTRMQETRKGTCSYWLSTLEPGSQHRLPVWIRPGAFQHLDYSRPLVCIGPGTGVAPMRSIINEKAALAAAASQPVDDTWLFFGCRSSQMDFYFRNEWSQLQQEQQLCNHNLQVSVAFSRDQPNKSYVQDKMLEE
jgi:sulfite reductase alpha subunit-like flavoprotein